MNINLRKMSVPEFLAFRKYSTEDYANDLMKDQNISFEEAICQSEEEFVEMLPEGLDTQDNALMVIEDSTDGKEVGIIWYLYEVTDGVKHAFLSDFVINEEERGKGYATAALMEMEQDAKKCGCTESRLYVWKHNSAGVILYTNCGYITYSESDHGMHMKKVIG